MPAMIVALPDPLEDQVLGPAAKPIFHNRNKWGDGWAQSPNYALVFGDYEKAKTVLKRLILKPHNKHRAAPSKIYPANLIGMLQFGISPSPAIKFPEPPHRLNYNPTDECFLCREKLVPVLAGTRINPIFVEQRSRVNPGETYSLQLRLCQECKEILSG